MDKLADHLFIPVGAVRHELWAAGLFQHSRRDDRRLHPVRLGRWSQRSTGRVGDH